MDLRRKGSILTRKFARYKVTLTLALSETLGESIATNFNLRSTARPRRSIENQVTMYFGQKAALSLRQHRISLEMAHQSLLVNLAKHAGPPYPEALSAQIALLRGAHRVALIETIILMKTITEHTESLNLASAMDAMIAERRLTEVCRAVIKTLDGIESNGSKASPT